MLYLYKAVEALIASNRANPVHDVGVQEFVASGGGTVTIDIDKSQAATVTPGNSLSLPTKTRFSFSI